MEFPKLAGLLAAIISITSLTTFELTKAHYANQPAMTASCSSGNTVSDNGLPEQSNKSDTSVENDFVNEISASPESLPEEIKSSHSATAANLNENIDDIVKRRALQQQQVSQFQQFTSADYKKPLISEATDRYESEAINYDWAAAQEDDLFSTFNSTPALSSYTPTHMSCRSSTCKLIIPAQDDSTADAAYHAIWQTVTSENSRSNETITYFRDPEKGEVVMFISPQGHSLFR